MTIPKTIISIDYIIEQYITSCSTLNFDSFSELLYDPRIKVNFPSKKNFEKYMRFLLRDLRSQGYKKLYLKIEASGSSSKFQTKAYNFYHNKYFYPRLNTQISITEDGIILDVLPF